MCREQPCDCCASCKGDDLLGRFVAYFTVLDSENARCLSALQNVAYWPIVLQK